MVATVSFVVTCLFREPRLGHGVCCAGRTRQQICKTVAKNGFMSMGYVRVGWLY